jgi:pimeloyl-ACP methyl ester carboxylesterase
VLTVYAPDARQLPPRAAPVNPALCRSLPTVPHSPFRRADRRRKRCRHRHTHASRWCSRGSRLEREYEDVAAVVDALASASEEEVDIYGHSHGGIVAFGAAGRTANIRSSSSTRAGRSRLVAEEGHHVVELVDVSRPQGTERPPACRAAPILDRNIERTAGLLKNQVRIESTVGHRRRRPRPSPK